MRKKDNESQEPKGRVVYYEHLSTKYKLDIINYITWNAQKRGTKNVSSGDRHQPTKNILIKGWWSQENSTDRLSARRDVSRSKRLFKIILRSWTSDRLFIKCGSS